MCIRDSDQKDRTIRELKVQLDESLTLNERLNSENRAGNIQALKNDLRKTKDFYMGRTLDYEFSYGEQITITPRNYEFDFRFAGKIKSHYACLLYTSHIAADTQEPM